MPLRNVRLVPLPHDAPALGRQLPPGPQILSNADASLLQPRPDWRTHALPAPNISIATGALPHTAPALGLTRPTGPPCLPRGQRTRALPISDGPPYCMFWHHVNPENRGSSPLPVFPSPLSVFPSPLLVLRGAVAHCGGPRCAPGQAGVQYHSVDIRGVVHGSSAGDSVAWSRRGPARTNHVSVCCVLLECVRLVKPAAQWPLSGHQWGHELDSGQPQGYAPSAGARACQSCVRSPWTFTECRLGLFSLRNFQPHFRTCAFSLFDMPPTDVHNRFNMLLQCAVR